MENTIIAARIHLYSMLASLYINGAMQKDYEYVISVLDAINAEPFNDDAKDISVLMLEFMRNKKDEVLNEYEVLFNLPFGDFINSSVSYYYDERELGAQTILAKEIMAEAGYIKADFYSLGEDEYGFLCGLSAKLLKENKNDLQKQVFKNLLLPYIDKFLDAQLHSKRAEFYKLVASMFGLVIAFEKSYFELY